MLTPVEIQNRTFKSGVSGYERKDVDQFINEVVDSYETLYREKIEMNDRINVLNDALQYYKSIEKTLQKALILAEKTAEDTKEAAYINAKQIEDDAVTRAQAILSDARKELDNIRQNTLQMLQQYDKYKAQFKALAASQIDLLESDSFTINLSTYENINLSDIKPSNFQYEQASGDTLPKQPDIPGDEFVFMNVNEQ